MTYIDLINRFWELNRIRSFTAYDCKLYFYLLSECNSRRWVNPFELHTRHMQLCLGMSRKTIVESRNRLKQRGLIDVAGARGREAAVYMIKGIKVTDPDLYSNRFVLPDDTTKSNNDVNTESNAESNTEGNTKVTQSKHNGELHLIIDKDKRYKTKDTLSHDSVSEVENKVNSEVKDQAQSDGRDMFSRCCDHFLSEGQEETMDLNATRLRHVASRASPMRPPAATAHTDSRYRNNPQQTEFFRRRSLFLC